MTNDTSATEKLDVSEQLLDVLTLEPIEENLYRGQHEAIVGQRLFGGQVLAQSLGAANQTVEDRPCHSVHCYFLRPGQPDVPVVYRVERLRDGKSFTTRRIVAIQNGEAIFSMDASFQVVEAGLEHQIDMSNVPGPEGLQDDTEIARQSGLKENFWMTRERPFERRTVGQSKDFKASEYNNPVWMRFKKPMADAPIQVQQQLLAYASDMGFVSTAYTAHAKTHSRNDVQMASLDHALWFHRPFDVSQWFVYIKDSPSSAASRGFNRGSFYTQDGQLFASSMQEGLMRVRRPSKPEPAADPASM